MKFIIDEFGNYILRAIMFLIFINAFWALYEYIIPFMQNLGVQI